MLKLAHALETMLKQSVVFAAIDQDPELQLAYYHARKQMAIAEAETILAYLPAAIRFLREAEARELAALREAGK